MTNPRFAPNRALLFRRILIHPCGRFFFRFRNALFPLIFVTIFLFAQPTLALTHPMLDTTLGMLGIAVALAGQFYRLFVIGYAYIQRGGREGKVYAEELVTTGLYAHSRNPMYFGNILLAIGVSLAFGSLVVCAVVIPLFLFIYYCIVVVEEDFLRQKFGSAYLEYGASVPRFIPNLDGLAETLSGNHYDWQTALFKEYGTLFSTLAGLVLIMGYKAYLQDPAAFHFYSGVGGRDVAWEFVIGAAYLITRRWKKAVRRRKAPSLSA